MITEQWFKIFGPKQYDGKPGRSSYLIISAHGDATGKKFVLPKGYPNLHFYAPHGYALNDPGLNSLVTTKSTEKAKVFELGKPGSSCHDYNLHKYQKSHHKGAIGWMLNKGRSTKETEHDMAELSSNSHRDSGRYLEYYEQWVCAKNGTYQQLAESKMESAKTSYGLRTYDLLAVRYHPMKQNPVTLSFVLNYLRNKDIGGKSLLSSYQGILCSFCRCSMSDLFNPKVGIVGWDSVNGKPTH